jgi:hypothetical protein
MHTTQGVKPLALIHRARKGAYSEITSGYPTGLCGWITSPQAVVRLGGVFNDKMHEEDSQVRIPENRATQRFCRLLGEKHRLPEQEKNKDLELEGMDVDKCIRGGGRFGKLPDPACFF